jgi:hypothetical protein
LPIVAKICSVLTYTCHCLVLLDTRQLLPGFVSGFCSIIARLCFELADCCLVLLCTHTAAAAAAATSGQHAAAIKPRILKEEEARVLPAGKFAMQVTKKRPAQVLFPSTKHLGCKFRKLVPVMKVRNQLKIGFLSGIPDSLRKKYRNLNLQPLFSYK